MPNPNPITVSNTIAAFKEMYTGDMVRRIAYERHAFLDLVPKDTSFGGKYLPIVVISGGVGSRSATFSNALGNQFPTTVKEFLLTRVKDYSVMGLDREALLASAVDGGAFFKVKTEELEAQIYRLSRSMAIALFRDSTGNYGQISSGATVASTSIPLQNAQDIIHFEVNDIIQLSVAANGNPFRSAGATAQVTGVNVDGGILTFASNLSAQIASAAASDFIFIQGDNPGTLTGTNTGIRIMGLAGWIPSTRPTPGDAFFGVDRSANTTAFAGTYFNGAAYTLKEALLKGQSQCARVGGSPDYIFLSFQNWADLADSLDTRHMYEDSSIKGESGFAYKGLTLNTAQGELRVLADNSCPENIAYALQMNTWKFYSLGDAPELITEDISGGLMRDPAGDSFQVRMTYYGNLGSNAPGWNAAIQTQ